ncbi:hypothetical protein T440DRAFT_102126 [Plenodomus tracheiphilus IPT5]|uniref:C2H2-type domain-containing protein n=1 Tax=Plenodomus tracheiphilus IPT5 TaxID=1408161 RepID=A0A6A7BM19_9PLEO|nr:hypothetical protein T440DRAFT_102126 [Plenodomus tracheiphilus IPT5]
MEDYPSSDWDVPDDEWNFSRTWMANTDANILSDGMVGTHEATSTGEALLLPGEYGSSSQTGADRDVDPNPDDDTSMSYDTDYMIDDLPCRQEQQVQSLAMDNQSGMWNQSSTYEGLTFWNDSEASHPTHASQDAFGIDVDQQIPTESRQTSFDDTLVSSGDQAYWYSSEARESTDDGGRNAVGPVASNTYGYPSSCPLSPQSDVRMPNWQRYNTDWSSNRVELTGSVMMDSFRSGSRDAIHDIASASFNNTEPWSAMFPRQNEPSLHWNPSRAVPTPLVEMSEASIPSVSMDTDIISMPNVEYQTSASSCPSGNDDMMASCATIRPQVSPIGNRPWHTRSVEFDYNYSVAPLTLGSHNRTRGLLCVPDTDESISEGKSTVSITSADSGPESLYCDDCDRAFQGKYRKGNLARHVRLKHKSETPTSFVCEDESCDRVFNRQDARLKHHRKHHPLIAPEPPLSRGPSSSRASGSARAPSAVRQASEQQARYHNS